MDYRGHHLTVITEPISLEKLTRITNGHKTFFDALREFASDPKHSISYIVGNHDQAMLWKRTREYLNEVLQTEINYKIPAWSKFYNLLAKIFLFFFRKYLYENRFYGLVFKTTLFMPQVMGVITSLLVLAPVNNKASRGFVLSGPRVNTAS